MKRIALALVLTAIASSAYAADMSCKPAKKLSGAALTSSVKSCCTKRAKAKKLSGAAFSSSVGKCIKDNTAS
jgi:hypothetical protein